MNLPLFFDVDITQPLLPVPLPQMLVSKDSLANRIGVRLYQGKTPYSPGGQCAGYVVRRDGYTVPITGVINGNEMYIDLPAAAYALEGPINIGIKNVQGNAISTVFLGMGTVSLGETDIAIDPGSTITLSVAALIASIEEAKASIPMDYSALSAAVAALLEQPTDTVLYGTSQSLTDAQKAQARGNIGAAGAQDVAELKSAVDDIAEELYHGTTVIILADSSAWKRNTVGNGSGIGTTGKRFESSTKRIATNPIVDIGDYSGINVTVASGYKHEMFFFDGDLTRVISDSGWVNNTESHYDVPSSAGYMVVLFANTSDDTITLDALPNISISAVTTGNILDVLAEEIDEKVAIAQSVADAGKALIIGNDGNVAPGTIDISTDKTLTISGKAADAKAVGDELARINMLDRIKELIESGNLVPDDYEVLEFAEANTSNANNYKVDTGLMMGPTLRTELDMCLTSISGANYMGREGVNGAAIRNSIGFNSSVSESGFYFGFGNENLSLGTADTQRHEFYIDVPNLTYGVDDTSAQKTAFTYGSAYSSRSIYLFGVVSSSLSAKARVYSARFYDSGNLIAYLVPVMRMADARVGVYDVIRKLFLSPSSTSYNLIAGHKGTNVITENTLPIEKSTETDAFAANFNTDGAMSGYVFFTDPHIYDKNVTPEIQQKLFRQLLTAYNSTPTDFIVCGGDWLQGGSADIIEGGPTQEQACGQLGYVDGVMNKLFSKYKPLFGNHDGNYKNTTLAQNVVDHLMFRRQGNAYYKFKANETEYYVLDTGLDNNINNITDRRKLQLNWIAGEIAGSDAEHIVICMHIFLSSNTGSWTGATLSKMGQYVAEMAAAYNNNEAYTAAWDSSKTFNYTTASGKVEYIIAGHLHHDLLLQEAGIPVILTEKALYNWTTPTFDLVMEDHASHILCMTRIGYGVNRYVHFGQTTVTTTGTLTPLKITAATWDTSDSTIATVSNGTVTAVASGYALITAADLSGNLEAWVVAVS